MTTTEDKPFTSDLSWPMRRALARIWVSGIALELAIQAMPHDERPEEMWGPQVLVSDDGIDIGVDAFASLPEPMQIGLIADSAMEASICFNCLHNALLGEEEDSNG